MMPSRIVSERLVLRVPELNDAVGLQDLISDPVALKHAGTRAAWSPDRLLALLARMPVLHRERGYGMYTVCKKDDGSVLGLCGLSPEEHDTPELSCVLMRRHWRNGYGREAASAVLAQLRGTAGLRGIVVRAEPDHPALPYMEEVVLRPFGLLFDREEYFPLGRKTMRHYRWQPRDASA
ncbi:hypothetical protein GCM10018793_47310 [Streptomyces sulfonofaciens]|uniref:N-acetyltransferase domain-containing protein n=1 Tax=Streptomyces sulfonofaciens TaxID=68272 RepID=A0A919GFI6_9ACTN|nr:GNAT family N-acetyltransferase [Streptomyces sulfonofaciens]GHH84022.1 hypothetical protein GCM10018793_47310 [Streptomyces sulfonofaciens]